MPKKKLSEGSGQSPAYPAQLHATSQIGRHKDSNRIILPPNRIVFCFSLVVAGKLYLTISQHWKIAGCIMLFRISHIIIYGTRHHHVSRLFFHKQLPCNPGNMSLEQVFEAPYGEALFGHKEDGERTLAIMKRWKDYDALNVERQCIMHLLVCMLILWNAFIQLYVLLGCTYISPLCAFVKCAVGLAHPVPFV